MHAQRRLDPEPRTARGLFAYDEAGWLREEAIALRRAAGQLDGAPRRVLRQVHLCAEGFALLAADPRVLDLAERALGGRTVLTGSALHFGEPSPPYAPAAGAIAIGVGLGPVPDDRAATPATARFGDAALLSAGHGDLDERDLLVVFGYRRSNLAEPWLRRGSIDALWRPAAFCAG